MVTALPAPVGKQKEVLVLPADGHTVVLGTAGSGKTTLAVHRALYLARPGTDHSGRTLLVTFNRTLVEYLRNLFSSALGNIDVQTYHRFARGYLASRGKIGFNTICGPEDLLRLISQAIEGARSQGKNQAVLERPIEFLIEEFRWLAQHGVTTADQYMTAERIGRAGARVVRRDRPTVFKLYQRYKLLRQARGKQYDWDDLSHTVLAEFENDKGPRLFRHVVIDEGQDFSPMMLKSLAVAIPDDGSLTFFGDMAQQIYGNRMSWRNAGIKVQRVWEFEENYRNTRQIARLALAIADMPSFNYDPDLVEPKSPTADGPLPALVSFSSDSEELEFVVAQARRLGQTGSVAILTRDRGGDEKTIAKELAEQGTRLHRDLPKWPAGPRIFYGTYHSAKGLEFDSVLLPRMSSTHLPHPPDIEAFGVKDASTRDQHLIYVAVTRTRSNLILSYVDEPTSLLPTGNFLYSRSTQ